MPVTIKMVKPMNEMTSPTIVAFIADEIPVASTFALSPGGTAAPPTESNAWTRRITVMRTPTSGPSPRRTAPPMMA